MNEEKSQQWQHEDWASSRTNNLSSFTEVLSRRTRPPFDLFMFDNTRISAGPIRKSGRSIKEDWPQYWDNVHQRGSIYGTVVGLNPEGSGLVAWRPQIYEGGAGEDGS
ncbi:hypothetical protein EST38_g13814 [Candolleomyces aberdarensis]|uniref:Uncharacterized protein n=1 Tax=Candolleomyces aberdarensis TaxID=2316362 RepID=A0A4Q2D1A1_9AGAR|nr:hypothetical protein EST38_g13814 [Candolleomyces aberdarensis]